MEVLKDYVLGDTIARYMQPGPGRPVGMMLFPAAMAGQIAEKSSAIDSLVQIKTVGDTYPGGSAGRSLRNGGTVATLTLESQREHTTDAGVTVVTLLRTHHGCLGVRNLLEQGAGKVGRPASGRTHTAGNRGTRRVHQKQPCRAA